MDTLMAAFLRSKSPPRRAAERAGSVTQAADPVKMGIARRAEPSGCLRYSGRSPIPLPCRFNQDHPMPTQMPAVGTKAPAFDLPAFPSGRYKLSQSKGQKNVVLYFYPRDNT